MLFVCNNVMLAERVAADYADVGEHLRAFSWSDQLLARFLWWLATRALRSCGFQQIIVQTKNVSCYSTPKSQLLLVPGGFQVIDSRHPYYSMVRDQPLAMWEARREGLSPLRALMRRNVVTRRSYLILSHGLSKAEMLGALVHEGAHVVLDMPGDTLSEKELRVRTVECAVLGSMARKRFVRWFVPGLADRIRETHETIRWLSDKK